MLYFIEDNIRTNNWKKRENEKLIKFRFLELELVRESVNTFLSLVASNSALEDSLTSLTNSGFSVIQVISVWKGQFAVTGVDFSRLQNFGAVVDFIEVQ